MVHQSDQLEDSPDGSYAFVNNWPCSENFSGLYTRAEIEKSEEILRKPTNKGQGEIVSLTLQYVHDVIRDLINGKVDERYAVQFDGFADPVCYPLANGH